MNKIYAKKSIIPDIPVKKKKQKHNLRRSIDRPVFDFLLNLLDENETDPSMLFNKKLLNIILYYTGLRINEAIVLNKLNILELFNTGELKVYCKKSKDHRTVFLREDIKLNFINDLGDMKIEDMDDKGFINKFGNRLTINAIEQSMYKYWDILEKNFGGRSSILPGRTFGFHSYRVNYINQVIRASDLETASTLIGHRSLATTLIYMRRQENNADKYVSVLNKAKF